MVGTASVVARRSGLLPRWLATAGIVVAVAQIASMAAGITGAVLVPFLLCALWIAIVSGVLVRRASASAERGRPIASRRLGPARRADNAVHPA